MPLESQWTFHSKSGNAHKTLRAPFVEIQVDSTRPSVSACMPGRLSMPAFLTYWLSDRQPE